MRVVYEAEHLFDAHLLRGRLAAEGIEAWVRGEYLAGAMGELPVSGLIAVCVDEADLPRAERLLAEWRAEAAGSADDGAGLDDPLASLLA
jgi:hypothetical protein